MYSTKGGDFALHAYTLISAAAMILVSALFVKDAVAASVPLSKTNTFFETAHFSGSGNCGECHNGLQNEQGADVSLESDWKTTMMANAARDPLWQAKVASELKRNPQLDQLIGSNCTRCHAPMAHVEATSDGTALDLFRNGVLDASHLNFDAAMDGVSCTLCHQIEDDVLLGTEAAASGGFSIDLNDKVAYGGIVLPSINPMLSRSGYTPAHAEHMSDSAVCGTCHDLKTPYVDGNGQLLDQASPHGGFPEQMIYTEWENSAYASGRRLATSCQDCHMPETHGVKAANRPRRLEPVDDFSRHTFLGANTVMMDIIDANSEELGATSANFSKAIENSRKNLSGAAELRVWSSKINKGRLDAWLGVKNLSGHKLPSGYPSRRVYLHFVVKDARGAIVFESGRMNDDGSIVGVDADEAATAFEPHYNTINSADQVQVYESVMGNTDGQVNHTLLESSHYIKDNRLTPTGFNKAAVPDDIAVHGGAEDDVDFNWGWDTIQYAVLLPEGAPGELFTVEVELNYQPLSFSYLQDLFQDQELVAVARFKRMYEASVLRKENIARTSYTVAR